MEAIGTMNARAGGWVAGALAVSFFAIGCMQAKKPVPAGIAWNKAFDVALADAKAHHRPLLLDFYTDW
jgi:thiol:disulfide interchange protein